MAGTTNLFKIKTPIVPTHTPFNAEVYTPAEDSFLLLDALEMDLGSQISNDDQLLPILCLEIGPGSGIISTGLITTEYFQEHIPIIFTIDINPSACLLTQKTSQRNNCHGKIESILGNGLVAYKTFRHPFDLILCNPPYVPSPPDEFDSNDSNLLRISWDGGIDGNEFIFPLLHSLPKLLAENGKMYILLSSWNHPEKLMEFVLPILGLEGQLVTKRAAGRERLSVWRIQWK